MNFEYIRNELPDYAKDIKLNLANVLSESGAPGLTAKLKSPAALNNFCLYDDQNPWCCCCLTCNEHLTAEEIAGVKAATIDYGDE